MRDTSVLTESPATGRNFLGLEWAGPRAERLSLHCSLTFQNAGKSLEENRKALLAIKNSSTNISF